MKMETEFNALLSGLESEDVLWLGLKLKDLEESDPDKQKEIMRRWIQRLKPYVNAGFEIFPQNLRGAKVFTVGSVMGIDAIKVAGGEVIPILWDWQTQSYKSGSKSVNLEEGLFLCGDYYHPRDREAGAITMTELKFRHLAVQLESLSVEQKLQFLLDCRDLYGYSRVETQANTVALSLIPGLEGVQKVKAWFDLSDPCVVTTPSKEYVVRNRAYIRTVGEVSASTLLTLLAYGMSGTPLQQNQVDGIFAFLTQVWEEEDNYGRDLAYNDQLRVLRANSVALLEVKRGMVHPQFQLDNANTPDVVREGMKYFLEKGEPCMPDKYAMKRLVVGQKGVNALWVGMKDGQFRTVNEVKMSKFLNRGYNSLSIPAAEGLPSDEGYRPYREAALRIGSAEKAEDSIRIYGDPSLCLFTNCRTLQNGSGLALTRRKFAYGVPKTIRGSLTSSHLKEGTTLEAAQEYLEQNLRTLCKEGRELLPGKRNVLLDYRGLEILVWDELNQPARLDENSKFSVRRLASSDSLQINLTVTFHASDECIKLRGLGIKAVTTSAEGVKVLDASGQEVHWEVLFGTETQKGVAARLHLYAEYMMEKYGKPCFYNPAEASLQYWNGKSWKAQDLSCPKAPIYSWVKKNMVPLRVQGWMNLDYFQAMMAVHAGLQGKEDCLLEALAHPNNQDIRLVNKTTGEVTSVLEEAVDGNAILIEESCEGIRGHYVGQIELTTRRESTSRNQSATLEYQALTWATFPNLGEQLIHTGREGEDAVLGLTAMVANYPDFRYIQKTAPEVVREEEWVNPRKMDAAMASALNASTFNLGKNALFYQDVTDPFWAFSSPEDKREKFKANKILSNSMPLTKAYQEEEGQDVFQDLCSRVAWHMGVSVGTGYGMASAITLKAVLTRKAWQDCLEYECTDEELAQAKADFELVRSVISRIWEHKYEDMDLAGLNKEGEAFNALLQSCVSGQYMKIQKGKATFETVDETLARISKAYEEAKGLPLPKAEAALILWSFQMARGTSAFEKRQKTPKWAEQLKEDILLAAAFRRCGQGLYSRYVSFEEEMQEFSGKGFSPWTYLDAHWEEVEDRLPNWLARKLWLTMQVHQNLNSASVKDEVSGKPIPQPLLEPDHFIPSVPLWNAYYGSTEKITLLSAKGKKETTTFEELEGAFELVDWNEDGTLAGVKASREIFKAAHRRYPYGVILESMDAQGGIHEQYVHFGTFLSLGAFTSGGFCTGAAYALLELMLLSWRPWDGKSGRDQAIHHKFCQFRGMLFSWVSRGAIKKLGRSGKVFLSSKVLTSHENDVACHDFEGDDGKFYSLPVILANPEDDLVKKGYLKENQIYGVSRTPMVSRFYAVLCLADYVPIGSIKVNAMVWAQSNRGDGDGDPITLEDVSKSYHLYPKSEQ